MQFSIDLQVQKEATDILQFNELIWNICALLYLRFRKVLYQVHFFPKLTSTSILNFIITTLLIFSYEA